MSDVRTKTKTKRAQEAEEAAEAEDRAKKRKRKERSENHNWTRDEDVSLLRSIKRIGAGNWARILEDLQNNKHTLCNWAWCTDPQRLRTRWKKMKDNKVDWIIAAAPTVKFVSPPGASEEEKAEAERKAIADDPDYHQWSEARKLLGEIRERGTTVDNEEKYTDEREIINASLEKEQKRAKEVEEKRAEMQMAAEEDTKIRRALVDRMSAMQESNASFTGALNNMVNVIGMMAAVQMLEKMGPSSTPLMKMLFPTLPFGFSDNPVLSVPPVQPPAAAQQQNVPK